MRRLALIALLLATPVLAEKEDLTGRSGAPVPRFVSLRSGEANMRSGPGDQYPITWTYQRLGLPVEIVREWGIWRLVRDPDGTEGWMQKALLSPDRTAYVTRGIRTLIAQPDIASKAIWRVEPGVVGHLLFCSGEWCRMSVDGQSGYIPRAQIWGVYPAEKIG